MVNLFAVATQQWQTLTLAKADLSRERLIAIPQNRLKSRGFSRGKTTSKAACISFLDAQNHTIKNRGGLAVVRSSSK